MEEIRDEETVLLMSALYRRLAAGEDAATALRAAQLDLRDAYPAQHNWAAFEIYRTR